MADPNRPADTPVEPWRRYPLHLEDAEVPALSFERLAASPRLPREGWIKLYYDEARGRPVLIGADGSLFPIALTADTELAGIAVVAEPGAASPSDSLDVAWTDITVATGYELEYRVAVSGSFVDFPLVGAPTSATITGLDPDTTYEVRVRAVENGATGPYATTTGTTAPGLPIFQADASFIHLGDGTTVAYGVVEPAGTPVTVTRIAADTVTETVLDPGMDVTDGIATAPIAFGEAITFTGGRGTATAYDGAGNMFGMVPAYAAASTLYFTRDRSAPHDINFYVFGPGTVSLTTRAGVSIDSAVFASAGSGSFTYGSDGSYTLSTDTGALLVAFTRSASGAAVPIDQQPILPPGARLIGVPSGDGYLSATADGTLATVTRSDNVTANYVLNLNSYTPTGIGSGSLYAGPSAVAEFTGGLGTAASVADSNGVKSTPWLRSDLLGTRGRVLTPTTYFAAFAESAGTLRVWAPGDDPGVDAPSATLALTASAGAPCSKAYTNSGPALTVGSYFEADVPIGVVLEETGTDDEYVLFTV